jgi:hypothetical protein
LFAQSSLAVFWGDSEEFLGHYLLESAFLSDTLDALEVFDSLDLEFECGVVVDNHHRMLVELDAGQSPHVVDWAFNALLKSKSFVSSSNDEDHFPGLSCVSFLFGIFNEARCLHQE